MERFYVTCFYSITLELFQFKSALLAVNILINMIYFTSQNRSFKLIYFWPTVCSFDHIEVNIMRNKLQL